MSNVAYEIRKFLPALLTPLVLSMGLVLWGVLRRRPKAALFGVLLLFITSLPVVSDAMGLLLESQYPHLNPASCLPADAIVALGGYTGINRRFPEELTWHDAVERFEVAVQLYKLGKAPRLLLTDIKAEERKSGSIHDLLQQAAVDHGVPPDALHITGVALTTVDEASLVKQYLKESGGRRVILVTSAAHMPRAALLFRSQGLDVIPFPVDYQAEEWVWRWDKFMPSTSGLDQFGKAEHELLGFTQMRLKSLFSK